MRPVIQETSYDLKIKVKLSVENESKKFQLNSFEKVMSKLLKP